MKTLIGIDPGLAATGYGVIQVEGSRIFHVCHGMVRTDPGTPLADRLLAIYKEITRVLSRYKPDEAGIEELYFARNARSAMPVAHARGVILLALVRKGIPLGSYSPLQIKQAVVGRGKGEKAQIQRMVSLVLGMSSLPAPSHAADALAIAICHAHRSPIDVQQYIR